VLKILSWNILQGGGSRLFAILNAITNGAYPIVILSEFRNNNSGARLKDLLYKNGYIHQLTSHAVANENTVFIASTLPFEGITYQDADPLFTHNIITAKFSAFNVMGVYLPHKKKHQLFPYITKLISESTTPFIIAGDYNTGHNFIDQKGDSFWYQQELKAFEATGYLDAFRFVHADMETYSWFSHQGNGFRYDHTYIHPDILPIIKDCYYLHDWRHNGYSDHSGMVLELG
jgi:exodeoxyribonuclease III